MYDSKSVYNTCCHHFPYSLPCPDLSLLRCAHGLTYTSSPPVLHNYVSSQSRLVGIMLQTSIIIPFLQKSYQNAFIIPKFTHYAQNYSQF